MVENLNEEEFNRLLNFANRISILLPEDEEIYDEKGEVSAIKITDVLAKKYDLNDQNFKNLLLMKIKALISENNMNTIQKISNLYVQLEDVYKKFNEEVSNSYYDKLQTIQNKHTSIKSKIVFELYLQFADVMRTGRKQFPLTKKIFEYFYKKVEGNDKKIETEAKPYLEEAKTKRKLYEIEAQNIENQINQIIRSNDNGQYIDNPLERIFEVDSSQKCNFLGNKESVSTLSLKYFQPSNVVKGCRLRKELNPSPGSLVINFDKSDLKCLSELHEKYQNAAASTSPKLYERLSKVTGKNITSLTLDNLDEIKDVIESEKLINTLTAKPEILRELNEQVNMILQFEEINIDQYSEEQNENKAIKK